jgi:hypothetical protein
MPSDWDFAEVIMLLFIYLFIFKKKGEAADPSNYRPISLLDTLCKVYARMIQDRLEGGIGHFIRKISMHFERSIPPRDPYTS